MPAPHVLVSKGKQGTGLKVLITAPARQDSSVSRISRLTAQSAFIHNLIHSATHFSDLMNDLCLTQ